MNVLYVPYTLLKYIGTHDLQCYSIAWVHYEYCILYMYTHKVCTAKYLKLKKSSRKFLDRCISQYSIMSEGFMDI